MPRSLPLPLASSSFALAVVLALAVRVAGAQDRRDLGVRDRLDVELAPHASVLYRLEAP